MLEALSAGCLLVASKTPPVMEVIQDSVNGLIIERYDLSQLLPQHLQWIQQQGVNNNSNLVASQDEFDRLFVSAVSA
jgi:glycosyltransferase involved in cell wall biosynthesis